MITRALGTDPEVDVDVFTVQAEPGDLFLLCSDGLTTMVDDEEIRRTISESRDDLESVARELVARANRGGGEDNITIVFFELAEGEPVGDDEDTLTEADHVPVVADGHVDHTHVDEARAEDARAPEPTVQEQLDATARRVLAIVGVVALVAVGIAVLLLGLRA